MAQPFVSVIIPAFNAKHTIAETLESVLAQTYPSFEIIVVDDGSTDDTADIVKSYAEKHDCIQYILQENAGVAAARNTAIKVAKGKYIAPIDADDLWHSERLERHVAALEAADEETAVAYSPFYVLNTRSEIMGGSTKFTFSGNVYKEQLQQNLVGNGSGITVRADALKEVGGYSSHLLHLGAQGCEDYMVQMLLAYKYKYVCVPEYLIGYRVYDGNMSSNQVKMIKSRLYVFEHIKEHHQVDKHALTYIKMFYLAELAFYLRHKKGIKAILKEVPPFIKDAREAALFICIITKGVILRLLNRIKQVFVSEGNIQKETAVKTGKKFQDIAFSQPE